MNNNKHLRWFTGSLLAIVAINAFLGGWYGLAGAENVPLEWLEGSPFTNYVIPSLILIVAVGFSSMIAAILVFRNHKKARLAAQLAGVIMLIWIGAQVSIIG